MLGFLVYVWIGFTIYIYVFAMGFSWPVKSGVCVLFERECIFHVRPKFKQIIIVYRGFLSSFLLSTLPDPSLCTSSPAFFFASC